MTPVGWLTRSLADVPADDAWLGPRERAVLDGLVRPKRRADWRLGRWTAKAAAAAWLGVAAGDLEVLAAPDGAPEVWVGPERAPVALSLSHRHGRGLAVTGAPEAALGCDLEVVEPRSDAFIRGFLAEEERTRAFALEGPARALVANLTWTAKEAAAKVRREGLRVDVASAATDFDGVPVAGAAPCETAWRRLRVAWDGGPETAGWWRAEDGWVMSVAAEPAPDEPRPL